jgi:predicted O-methyltransferase YrrM
MRIRTAVAAAVVAGGDIDLPACDYGPSTGGVFRRGPMGYYFFLAGLARITRARRIVEVGTHFGGSARAFAEGQRAAGLLADVLTFDVADRAGPPVLDDPGVERVLADVRTPAGAAALRAWAGQEPVDIAYVDALKDGAFVDETVAALAGLDVGWLVLDDIFDNRDIGRAWERLRRAHGERAVAVDEVALDIRSGGYGQGVVALRPAALDRLGADPAAVDRLRVAARRRWTPALAQQPPAQPPAQQAQSPAQSPAQPVHAATDRPAEHALLRRAVARCAGRGEIVVVGAASGATTRTLARAVADIPELHRLSVHLVGQLINRSAGVARAARTTTARRESLLPELRARLGELAGFVNLLPGDPHGLRWTGRPIELLVLGAHRTEAELAFAWTELLPHCVPGGSLVVAMDPGGECAPYLHAGLGRLLDDVELVGSGSDALAVAPVRTPDPALLRELADLPAAGFAPHADRLRRRLEPSLVCDSWREMVSR